ncbi:Hsp90 cochaperone [Kappamyces sp. JEL0680]|nr:Hsp90 cochaperone [Kappamyces sp. JEL0680]
MANYAETIKVCELAVETGREIRADFKLIGRALGRIGSAYLKLEDYENATKYFNKSLAEHRTPEILAKLRETETLVAEKAKLAYIDPALSEAEREKGNVLFKDHKYPEAVKCYSEAIKRNPADAKNFSNRAAAYTKLMALPEAERDCDEAIRLDALFIKAYIRKAAVQFAKREYSKCIETCNLALEKDTEQKHAAEIQGQIQKAYQALGGGGAANSEEARQNALKNPEVQQILGDPVMQQILKQMQEDPAAIREHLKNPAFAKKFQVLVDAGIVQLGR